MLNVSPCFSFPLLLLQPVEESWMLPRELSPLPITPTCTHTAECAAGSWWCHRAAGSHSPSMTCGWKSLVLRVHLTTLRWVPFCQHLRFITLACSSFTFLYLSKVSLGLGSGVSFVVVTYLIRVRFGFGFSCFSHHKWIPFTANVCEWWQRNHQQMAQNLDK